MFTPRTTTALFFLIFILASYISSSTLSNSDRLDGNSRPVQSQPSFSSLLQGYPELSSMIFRQPSLTNPRDRAMISLMNRDARKRASLDEFNTVQPLSMNYGRTIVAEINATVLQKSDVQPVDRARSLFQILRRAAQIFSTHSPHRFMIKFDEEKSLTLFAATLHAYASFILPISLEARAKMLNLIQLAPDAVVPLFIVYHYRQTDPAKVPDIVTQWIRKQPVPKQPLPLSHINAVESN